ncbi:iron ABC transporter permease [Kocuria sp. JC486]|uniref:FecCD family ABC transporter permease n=1 Tax=Kocuria sp. JC486 TaxID=1970736 RepID=UPI001421BE39|nr:iron ABC transporter permease [Kocuria sp. JC486]NHU85102.1 iron ABC transporter permease [Kocuria sp. JC486]
MSRSLRVTPWVTLAVAVILLIAATAASLFWGSRSIDPGTVATVLGRLPGILTGQDSGAGAGADMDTTVVLNRIPRTVTAVVVGAALAAAGAGMQGVSRNPLGDPGLLGLSSGAAAGVVLALGWLGAHSSWQIALAALIGCTVAAGLVFGLSQIGGGAPTPIGLTLSGAAVNAGFVAVTSAVVLTNQAVLERYRYWNVGSVSRTDTGDLATAAPLVLIGVALLLAGASGLNAMALGDELAHGLGVDLGVQRGLVFVGIVVLAGSATAIAGPIAFVGLLVPHAIRRVVGGDYRWLIVLSLLLGPALLLVADTLGRVVAPPQEIYVGITTVVLGVPVLLALLRRPRGVTL